MLSFPVYQNATFVKKEATPTCESETSGYSNCGQTVYMWSTSDDGETVRNWYQKDVSKSGWICGQGGAGQYNSSRNFDAQSTCKIGEKTYGFIIRATEKETTITLSIKNN